MTKFEKFINILPAEIVQQLKDTAQDAKWHPEGSVYNHVKLVFEQADKQFGGDIDLLVAAIFHDLGKIDTHKEKVLEDGRIKISHIGHELKSLDYIRTYFNQFSEHSTNKDKIHSIVKNHMRAHQYNSGQLKKPAKREAFENLEYFEDIMNFLKCDEMGRGIDYGEIENQNTKLVLYFAYGSNMNEERMADRGLMPLRKKSGILMDYKFKMNKKSLKIPGAGFANVVKNDNTIVEGMLYTVTEKDIEKLDKFEGYPKHYRRELLPIMTISNRKRVYVEAIVYIAQPEWTVDETLKCTREYKSHIMKGSEFLTEEYFEKLSNEIIVQ